MWTWPHKREQDRPWRGASRAGLAGAPREELLREALHSLSQGVQADRIGLWLEQDSPLGSDPQAPAVLRGLVWEAHRDETPPEWQKLSLGPPLPPELLASTKSLEQELASAPERLMIGPLVGLRQALWTPVRGRNQLLGVLLIGRHRKQAPMPRDLAESVAAELALALELSQVQRLARERQCDLRLNKQILAALASHVSSDTVLSKIAASCIEDSSDAPGPGAAFAIIGHQPGKAPKAPAPAEMEFAWESGDPSWTRGVEREPLASLWREALKAGHVMGTAPPASAVKEGLARLVAFPLISAGETLGVLIAGISQKNSSLATVDRLELRASLTVSALERRKLHGERLRRTMRRQALLESSPEPTLLLDSAGALTGLNRSARTLLEETREEHAHGVHREAPASGPAWCVGGRLPQLFRAREQQRIEEWLSRALSGERQSALDAPDFCEAELVTGVRARLHSPIPVGDDLVALVLHPAAADEAALRHGRAEAELSNLLEWVEEGILLFGADNSIRAMNTRFAQIAGLSAEEAGGATTLESLIARLAERAAEPQSFVHRWRELARSAEGGTREEVPMARPVPRVLERTVRPVQDPQGRRLGRIEIYRDLSAQRVFQARLLQTEKLAALGQMVTGVAHELSSPLTSILGYAQRLLVRKDLAGRTEEARQIYQEAERASTILRQLLLTARESQPERKTVSLNQIVLRAMELQRFGSAAEKIHIELDLDPALPFVNGDPGQIQQVLMNLIGNSRQAIVQAGRPGTIRLRTARNGDRRVWLEVCDDGPGIPQAILGRIFDPFFTTKPPDIGTGLGLSIVLSVVREHGGNVNVSSPPNGGAKFTVELPAVVSASADATPRVVSAKEKTLAAPVAVASQKNRPHAVPSPTGKAKHRSARVLVLEDEPTVARLIADVLEDEGLRVDVLLDSREALERAVSERYDLVICDMKMPGLDGQHFYQSMVRTRSPLQDRFLFVTGDVIAVPTQEFLERNHLPHVAKPFRVEELTEKVFGLLESHFPRGPHAVAAKKAN
jgi:PAS domain S-box-containing protein